MELPPHVFHLAESVNWPSIQRRGLLSAQRLWSESGVETVSEHVDASRLARHRPKSMVLPDGTLIRDQAPMPPPALTRCLTGGLEPDDWYTLINAHVFFWFDLKRLARQRQACGTRPQVLLTLDTDRLLTQHGTHAALTPFNTGFARRRPARRGKETFVPYATWLSSVWASEMQPSGRCLPRSRSHRPVELAITDAVRDAMDFIVAIELL